MSAPRPLVTADELPAISARHSDLGKRTELVRGDLIVMAPAGGRHGQVAHKVALLVGNHVLERNLGRVFAAETGFLLRRDPDTVRAPDVAFVAAERLGMETGSLNAGAGPGVGLAGQRSFVD
ncbi:MAG: Uma2 family endonuclease [Acidobacteria bacterium]|nr:Uma2 family endonuclease [Acidobacteriota bacterium]